MIALHSVSKELGRGKLRRRVLDNVNLHIPPRTHLVILGQKGAGKSTLLRIISGSRFPTSGWVERKGTICMMGAMTAGRTDLTPRQIAARLARLYHVNAQEVIEFIGQFGDLVDVIDTPMKALPRIVHSQLNHSLAYAIPFDFYLFDGVIARRKGDFNARCRAALADRSQEAGIILVTSVPKIAAEIDGIAGVLHEGTVRIYPSVDKALAVFNALPPVDEHGREFAEDEDRDDEQEEEWL